MKKIAFIIMFSMLAISSNAAYAGASEKRCQSYDYIGKYGSLNPAYQGASALARFIIKWISGCFN